MGISTPDERKEFVKRLRRACERNPNIAPEHMGRQASIAAALGVVPEAVSRWFAGETMPNNARVRELAKLLGVDVGWLALGHGDESPKTRDTSNKRMSAAAMFVRSLLVMHGFSIADVPEGDPKAAVLSFYVVVDSELIPLIVAYANPVADAKGEFEAVVPANYLAGTVICVVPRGMNPVLLSLSPSSIKRGKKATGNGIVIGLSDAGAGNYKVAGKVAPRIRNFSMISSNTSNGVEA